MSERPRIPTLEMTLAAATRVANDLVKGGHLEANEVEDAARDIAKQGRYHADGYELAKALDDHESWDCNLDMVETLDGFSHELSNETKAAQKAWFEAEKPEPPFQTGARVTVQYGREARTGTIDGIYEYGVAQYTVKLDGDLHAEAPSNARAIIDWERCQALVEQSE